MSAQAPFRTSSDLLSFAVRPAAEPHGRGAVLPLPCNSAPGAFARFLDWMQCCSLSADAGPRGLAAARHPPPPPHLCRTVECITSGLQFFKHCLSVFLSILLNLNWVSPPQFRFQSSKLGPRRVLAVRNACAVHWECGGRTSEDTRNSQSGLHGGGSALVCAALTVCVPAVDCMIGV